MTNRTPSDNFTRFTSTSPYASSKPPPLSAFANSAHPTSQLSQSNSPFNTAGPSNETPQEKVARLRAAARAAKAQQSMSAVDRLIDRGRVWADFGHRVVTYGLIGFTGIAAVISLYGVGSLVMHNRRQKRAWIEREMGRLGDAQTAFLQGDATPEQLHLLEQERAGQEMAKKAIEEKKRKKDAGVWNKLKSMVGIDKGAMGREDGIKSRQVESRGAEKLLEEGWVEAETAKTNTGGGPMMLTVMESRKEGEIGAVVKSEAKGGPLDIFAGNIATALTPSTDKGWLSWIRGRGS